MTEFEVRIAGEPIRPTLPEAIKAAARAYEDREYIVLGERRVTFRQAERESAALALGLLALGVGKGSRVGLLMPNTPDWPVCWFGAARAGALTVALSTFFQTAELSWALRHNDIDTLLISARYLKNDYLERLERAVPGLAEQTDPDLYLPSHPYLRRIVVWGDCDRAWAMKGPDALLAAAAARPQLDEAFLIAVEAEIAPADSLITICTSGSTAEPKAVVHTHGTATRATFQFLPYYDFRLEDRHYSGHPFFWIGGLNVNLLPVLYTGGCQVCAPSPTPDAIAEVAERERVTRLSLWPVQAADIAAAAKQHSRDLSAVRIGLGEPTDEAGQVIPRAQRYGGVFGMTESFGMHSLEKLDRPAPPGKAGSQGRTLPGVERRIVDRDTGEAAPAGEVGELHLRGHTLMQGYYKREREEVFGPDGFFATGDLCREDEEGYLYFAGRASQMIKTSGANVSPREVEVALMRHPQVREAFVFGMPDDLRGEVVTAVLVPAAGAEIDVPTLLAQLRHEISPYKAPKAAFVIEHDAVPRTHSDKVDKSRLKEMVGREML